MNKLYLQNEASSRFRKIYYKGYWLKSAFVYLLFGKKTILTLSDFTSIYQQDSEVYSGMQDICVNKIVGSEGRSSDFVEGFLPSKSWMEARWTKIWMLMQEGQLEEPIDVIDYGGVYFVRDGNHRVSVSKQIKREFIRGKVTTFKVPFKVPENISYTNFFQFKRAAELEMKTSFFTNVPEAEFDIKRNSSWDVIDQEILHWNPQWASRHKEVYDGQESKTQHRTWYKWLQNNVITEIKKESLHYLFPGWGDGDVAMEILKLWNSYSTPDDISVEELYDLFVKRARKKRFLLAPIHYIADKLNYLSRSALEERNLFYSRSSIDNIRPDFKLPSDLGKRYWRNLYKDLFKTHYSKMRKELGRSPYHKELVGDWYDNVWLPRATT